MFYCFDIVKKITPKIKRFNRFILGVEKIFDYSIYGGIEMIILKKVDL